VGSGRLPAGRQGFAMYIKKLEQGTFERPAVPGNAVTSGQFSLLLQEKAGFGALQKALQPLIKDSEIGCIF